MLLDKNVVEKYIYLRKMEPEEVLKSVNCIGDKYQINFDQAIKLAELLNIDVALLLEGSTPSDLTQGVKIARKNGYYRESIKQGKRYYTYHHLVTTNDYPTLMPLRVEVHCKKEDSVTLNGGHASTEIVYITKGEVNMTWEHEGQYYSKTLNEGDSAYIYPEISHSFSSNNNQDAELIAINW